MKIGGGGMVGLILQPSGGGFAPACSQCSSFLARATNVTLTADKQNYSDLICGLVTDGVWAKLDALYIYAAVDRTTALLNLVSSSFPCVEHGTVSFSAYNGYTGGSGFYLDTGFVLNAGGTQYIQDSASFGTYVLIADATGGGQALMGAYDTFRNALVTQPDFTAGYYDINGPNTQTSSTNGALVAAFYEVVRTGSAATVIYKNGGSLATDTQVSSGLNDQSFFVFALNNSGSPSNASVAKMSAAFIGGGLTATDASNLSIRVNNYMTAYGINVY